MEKNRGGKIVVITGVTRGLGHAMSRKFAALGHHVLGCGRSRDEIEGLRRALGSGHDFAEVDVANDARVKSWADRLLADHGPPDLLVNNAAVINANAPLWEVPREDFERVIDVNIKGVVNVVRAFVPEMIARGSGVIVNFSSYWGRSVAPEVSPYCATKWAIEGLTRALAQELPKGMAAVPFNPGIIDTAMLRCCFGESAASYSQPEPWAEATVPFLLQLGPKDNGKPLTAPGQ